MITWKINKISCKPIDGNFTDVVINADWECKAQDGTYNAVMFGTCQFPQPDTDFTPFADLTQNQVLGWCWANGTDKDQTEMVVLRQLERRKNPPIVNKKLPWMP